MPGTYALYAFGKKVLAQVDDEIKNIILKMRLWIWVTVELLHARYNFKNKLYLILKF